MENGALRRFGAFCPPAVKYRHPHLRATAPLRAFHHSTTKNPPTMIQDYIPQSYDNLQAWLTKQQAELSAALAATVGMTTPERDAYMAAVATILTPLTVIVDLMGELEEKTAAFPAILDAQLPGIRAAVKRAKTSAACTADIQTQLDWIGAAQNTNPATSRPFIAIEAQRGRIKITGRKLGFEAVNIYSRKKGDVQWKLIAVRKRKFPYLDETPLSVANQPEVREYMAIGTLADEETGQPSEIKEIVYAG